MIPLFYSMVLLLSITWWRTDKGKKFEKSQAHNHIYDHSDADEWRDNADVASDDHVYELKEIFLLHLIEITNPTFCTES